MKNLVHTTWKGKSLIYDKRDVVDPSREAEILLSLVHLAKAYRMSIFGELLVHLTSNPIHVTYTQSSILYTFTTTERYNAENLREAPKLGVSLCYVTLFHLISQYMHR